MRYGDWNIPFGMPVSMSQPFLHFNPELFPNPMKFDPERWLQGDESIRLERYLVPFSSGSRACIGI